MAWDGVFCGRERRIFSSPVVFTVTGGHLNLGVSVHRLDALLGNADLSYKFAFDGAVLPIGLGLSLILNALFFAKMNAEGVLTLPRRLKRYGVAGDPRSLVLCCFSLPSRGNLVRGWRKFWPVVRFGNQRRFLIRHYYFGVRRAVGYFRYCGCYSICGRHDWILRLACIGLLKTPVRSAAAVDWISRLRLS